jgi:hypothetical protein
VLFPTATDGLEKMLISTVSAETTLVTATAAPAVVDFDVSMASWPFGVLA